MTMSHGSARVLPKNILAFVASPQVPLVEEEEYVTVLEDTFVAANENYMRSCSCSWASTASVEIVLMIVIFCSIILAQAGSLTALKRPIFSYFLQVLQI